MPLLSLQDPACLQTKHAGAKAARLAAARSAGLPTLPGVVVPADASVPALKDALATVPSQGIHGARLALMEAEVSTLADLPRKASGMADRLVVRSSSPLEGQGQWSGAFSSALDVRPEEVLTAVRAVWASAVNQDALERRNREGVSIASLAVAVLVQPEVQPAVSGTAEVDDAGTVTVVAVNGPPAPLMAGWDPGHYARCEPDGTVTEDSAQTIVGDEVLLRVARHARAVRDRLGDNFMEWAITVDGFWLLQCKTVVRSDHPVPPEEHREGGDVPESAREVANHVVRYAGATGEQLVLPWLLAGVGRSRPSLSKVGPREVSADAALVAWDEAVGLASTLTSETWRGADHPGETAARTLAKLRGDFAADALGELAELPTADGARAMRVLTLLEQVARQLVARGVLQDGEQIWGLEPGTVRRLLCADEKASEGARAAHRATLVWEPFVYTAVMGHGEHAIGKPASPGTGAGPMVLIDGKPERTPLPPRAVIVAPRPLPHLAPLLWGASALVTVGGGVAAHLVEVARSLTVPAVVGCAKEDLLRETEPAALFAVNGSNGVVAVSRVPSARCG